MLAHLQAENSFDRCVIVFLLATNAISILVAVVVIKLHSDERVRKIAGRVWG